MHESLLPDEMAEIPRKTHAPLECECWKTVRDKCSIGFGWSDSHSAFPGECDIHHEVVGAELEEFIERDVVPLKVWLQEHTLTVAANTSREKRPFRLGYDSRLESEYFTECK